MVKVNFNLLSKSTSVFDTLLNIYKHYNYSSTINFNSLDQVAQLTSDIQHYSNEVLVLGSVLCSVSEREKEHDSSALVSAHKLVAKSLEDEIITLSVLLEIKN